MLLVPSWRPVMNGTRPVAPQANCCRDRRPVTSARLIASRLIEGSTPEVLPAMTIFAASAKAEPSGRMSYARRLFFGRVALGHLTRPRRRAIIALLLDTQIPLKAWG